MGRPVVVLPVGHLVGLQRLYRCISVCIVTIKEVRRFTWWT